MKHFDVIIVGAGPCGLMSTYTINNKSILLLDANSHIGGKIKVSGGGRCNITNNKDIPDFLDNVPKNNKFLYSTLNNFSPQNIITFFNNNNIKLKEENNNRIFPQSNKAQTFIDFFETHINNNSLKKVWLNYLVNNIKYINNKFIINDEVTSEHLIMCTGGVSYEHISWGHIGFDILKSLNHTITTLKPCETPLVCTDPIIASKKIQGITLTNCTGELFINNKKKKTLTKDILFTHFGLSGPMALNLSYFIGEALDQKKSVKIKLLVDNPPKRLKEFLDEEESITLNISDVKGFKTAFVTNGGVSLKEINPHNLESKIIKNLFIGGEILDINCFTGGYNIGTCICEGKLIGDKINER